MSNRTLSASQRDWIAVRSAALVKDLERDASVLGVAVSRHDSGAKIVDCGVAVAGSIEAGRRIVEISQGGMASARIGITEISGVVLPELILDSWVPEFSAYGLQVSVPLSEVDPAIRISGPLLARFEDSRLNVRTADLTDSAWGMAVVEADRLPDAAAIEALARRSGLTPSELTLIVAPTASIAGATQIAGRINESVIFTLEESLGIDCGCVAHLFGTVPIAVATTLRSTTTLTPDDFIHYAGRVVLTVQCDASVDLAQLAAQLAFDSTPIYGTLFADLLAAAGGVFEAIPGVIDLNKVAQVTVVDQRSGGAFSAGERCEAMLVNPRKHADEHPKEAR